MPLRNLPGAELCYFKQGDYIIRQDEKLEYLYYLVKGRVHREMLLPDGREILLTIKKDINENHYIHSLIGVMILYDSYEQYGISNCSFIAHIDCVCYRIPISSYRTFENENKLEIMEQLFTYTMNSYQNLFELHTSMSHKNASAVLCSHLLEFAVESNDRLVFEQKVNKVEMGKRLGIHSVNVSKIFTALVQQGILERVDKTHYIILDKDTLQAIASNELELSYRYNKSNAQ